MTKSLDLQKKYADIDSAKKQAKAKKEERKNHHPNGTNNGKPSFKKSFHMSAHQNGGNGSKHKYDPNAKDQRPHNDPNRPCWKANHQNHKWGDCYQNPANPNNKLVTGGGGSRAPTTYHAQVHPPPPTVLHIPPAPAYPPSTASVVSQGSVPSMAPAAYYYSPALSMQVVPPQGYGIWLYGLGVYQPSMLFCP